MGRRDDEYILAGRIELDEGFFSTEVPQGQKDEPLKRGRGNQKKTRVIPKEKEGEIFSCVYIAISNGRLQLINTFHDIKPEPSQNYLDKFCHKFNRRYFWKVFLVRLHVACVSCRNKFE